MMRGILIAAIWLAGCAVLVHAQQTQPAGLWTPGGPEVARAVESRRGRTALSRLAASMKPGSWAELKTDMPAGLWSSPKVDGGRNEGGAGGLHIAGWTDDAHWDSRTGQFLYMGLRQTRRFIAYDEQKNAWRSIELDPASDNPCFRTKFGHIYSSNGFDHERSRFYHRYNSYADEKAGLNLAGGISYYDVLAGKWTKLPAVPKDSGFTGMAIEYFNAMDGLVILGSHAWFFSTQRQKWEDLGPCPVDGYHSLVRHNPYRKEVLMAGGNHNRRVVARVTKDGRIERLKDFPVDFGLGSDKIALDPVSGRYLMLAFRAPGGLNVLEFDSDRNEYRPAEAATAGYPFKGYSAPYSVCAFIPEYGVIMWAEASGVHLYKHEPSGAGPVDSLPASQPESPRAK